MSERLASAVRIEEAVLETWPALSTVRDGSWVIRRSEGQTGRANSITVLDPSDARDLERRVVAAVALFREAGLVPSLRETPLTPPGLVDHVIGAGWAVADETIVMTRRVADGPSADLAPLPAFSTEWLQATAVFMEFSEAKREAVGRKLQRLAHPSGFFLLRDQAGLPIATALAVTAGGVVGLYDIGVDPRRRRQGQGHAIAAAALAWARAGGADVAFLQVVADNHAAVSLYRRLGFSTAYRYRYLRPAADTGSGR